jgi:hypothetical protein
MQLRYSHSLGAMMSDLIGINSVTMCPDLVSLIIDRNILDISSPGCISAENLRLVIRTQSTPLRSQGLWMAHVIHANAP